MVSLPGLFDWFAIGMALAVLRAELEAGRASRSALTLLGRRPGMCVALAFAAFMAAMPDQHGDIFLPWYGVATHLAIGSAPGLLVLAVIMPGAPRRVRGRCAYSAARWSRGWGRSRTASTSGISWCSS